MLKQANTLGRQAYVIVCGNEKGGSGKTTTAVHVIAHLLNLGHSVASIDLDTRQLSLTRYLENRKNWATKHRVAIPHPHHNYPRVNKNDSVFENETKELERFSEIVRSVENTFDFIVVDTPGHDSYLMRLAHSMADTLITPLNDSYVDFDVLGKIDPQTGEVIEISHYAQMVRDVRRQRHSVDNSLLDWIVVRNRLSHLGSRNRSSLSESLKNLSIQLGCRLADGISERVIFRELFPHGLTALDDEVDTHLGNAPSLSHLAGRQEVRALVSTLRLPVDNASKRRARARREWLGANDEQVVNLRIFAD